MKQQQGALPLVLLCMHSTVAAAIGVERLSNETILSPPQDTDETLQQMWRRMEAEFVAKDNHDYTTIAMLFLVVIALLGAFETLDLLTYCIGSELIIVEPFCVSEVVLSPFWSFFCLFVLRQIGQEPRRFPFGESTWTNSVGYVTKCTHAMHFCVSTHTLHCRWTTPLLPSTSCRPFCTFSLW